MNRPSSPLKLTDEYGDMHKETKLDTATIDLTRLLKAARRRRLSIFGAVTVWCVLGLFYSLTTPRYYDASSQVLLDTNISRTLAQVSSTTNIIINDSAMESAQLVIASEEIAAGVVDQLQLQENENFIDPPVSLTIRMLGTVIGYVRLPIVWLREWIRPLTEEDTAGPEEISAPLSPDQIAEIKRDLAITSLRQQVSIYRIGRSSAFGVSFRSSDPVLTAAVVNAYAETYVSDALNANFDAIERMTGWMQTRLSVLETDARVAARAAEAFRAENGLVQNNNSTISQDAVTALNADLSEAISNAARARAQVAALQVVVDRGPEALLENGFAAGLPRTKDAEFQALQSALTTSVANIKRLNASDTATEQSVNAWEVRARNAAERLFTAIEFQLENARGEADLQSARVAALRESFDEAVGNDLQVGTAQVELRALEDRAETLSALYQSFLTSFQEIEQQRTFPISNVRILNLAQVPLNASGPSAKKALAICILLGLMTGLIIAGVREWRDRFLYTAEQVIEEVNASFLGYLPQINESRAMRQWRKRMNSTVPFGDGSDIEGIRRICAPPSHALENPRSQYAETLRNIRLSSQIVSGGARSRVIGVTSARPNEGKTYTSFNLATSIAAGGYSVMLIDADPHRFGLTRLVQSKDESVLPMILSGERKWTEAYRTLGDTRVDMISCRVPPDFQHAQEMLAGLAFSDMIADIRGNYDFVLLDLAPIGAVSDVRAVIEDLDQLVFIARWGETSKQLLYKLINSDTRIARKVLGVALNRVDVKRLKDYADEGDQASYMQDYGVYFK